MPESTALGQQLFDFCYNLYLDPVYRHICFPADQAEAESALSREDFVREWHALSGATPEGEMGGVGEALIRVIHTVRDMKPVERNVLLLRHGSDLPYAQIAERVERSKEACQVIHFRALSEFCDRFNSHEYPRG